ncbi:MAG: CPBP family intramembrane glutamic endopeptidase [Luteimonas sp.]
MSTPIGKDGFALSRMQRFIRFPLTRMVVAIFMTALAGGLTLTYAGKVAHLWGQVMWPEFLAAAAVLLAYRLYVRAFERRLAPEIARTRALPELGAGLLIGAALVTTVIVMLMSVGAYRIAGSNGMSLAVLTPLAMMTFVGAFEEVLSRGIVFRITEQWLGSWAALVISSLLFGLAHLPGQGAGALAILITVVAGVLFAAAYLLTRRLWLGIGIHIAWNYTLGSIFSITVSGHEASGLLQGSVSGSAWVTGGAYGLEGSVFTLIVLTTLAGYLLRKAWIKGHFSPATWRN